MKLSKDAELLKKSLLKEYAIDDSCGLAILQTGLEAYDQMHSAMAVVAVEGMTVKGDRGGTKAHPLCAVIRDSRAQFLMSLKNLQLDLEPLKGIGRPPGRR